MQKELKRLYAVLLTPAVLGFAGFFAADALGGPAAFRVAAPAAAGPVIFILSAISAVAAPILIRTLFAHRMQGRRQVTPAELLVFERTLIATALVTPYLSLAAGILALPRFYLTGSFLLALYAVYYYYPSKKRMGFDRRIFKVG